MPPSTRRRAHQPHPSPPFDQDDTDSDIDVTPRTRREYEESEGLEDEGDLRDLEDEDELEEEEVLESPNQDSLPQLNLDPPPSYLREISTLASWTVSSSKPGCSIPQLRHPSTSLFWQSDGPQPHYLNIHFFKLVRIVALRLYLDFEQDESYTPTRIVFLAGSGMNDLHEWGEMRLENPRGWIWADFSDVDEPDDSSDPDESMADADDNNAPHHGDPRTTTAAAVPAPVPVGQEAQTPAPDQETTTTSSDSENAAPAAAAPTPAPFAPPPRAPFLTPNLTTPTIPPPQQPQQQQTPLHPGHPANLFTPSPHLPHPQAPHTTLPRPSPRTPFSTLPSNPHAVHLTPSPASPSIPNLPVLRAHLLQIKILENHQNGKDTHLRGLQVFALNEEDGGERTYRGSYDRPAGGWLETVERDVGGGKKEVAVRPKKVDWGVLELGGRVGRGEWDEREIR